MIGSIESLTADYLAAADVSESLFATDAEIDAAVVRAAEMRAALTQTVARTPAQAAAKLRVALHSLGGDWSYEPGFQLLETLLEDLGKIADGNSCSSSL